MHTETKKEKKREKRNKENIPAPIVPKCLIFFSER